jgi:hypothetical protein
MEKKYRESNGNSGAIQLGPERTSFYTSDYCLTERQKYLHRVYGSQFFGFKKDSKTIAIKKNE